MRRFLLPFIILSTTIVIVLRLFFLQVVYHDEDTSGIDNIAIETVYDYPEHGYIYDRNGKLLVSNWPAYDVMVIPNEVKNLDTLGFCSLLELSKVDFTEKLQEAKDYSREKPSVIVHQLSNTDYTVLQEKMRRFEGFYIQKQMLRSYLTRNTGNVSDYISEVDEWELKKNPYYLAEELIGRSGIEKQYEKFLRGRRGVQYFQRGKHNAAIEHHKSETFGTLPTMGRPLQLTIDIGLQTYGKLLIQHRHGDIVAIEPKTGEILALVLAPSFDPNLLVGRDRSKNYTALYNDSIDEPSYDRTLLARYPPGSPFRVVNALIELQEGVITPQSVFNCGGDHRYGGHMMRCHYGRGSDSLLYGITLSCNAYLTDTYKRAIDMRTSSEMGIEKWAAHMKGFGLGNFLDSDLPTDTPGKVPGISPYSKQYGKGRWNSISNISNAIGQGEIFATPIQLSSVMAAMANKGYYYTPHIMKKIDNKVTPFKEYTVPKHTTIDPKHLDLIIRRMNMAYLVGTVRHTQTDGINIAAKTGMAENSTRISGKCMQLTDHSIFIALAPVEDPKIAIAVFAENGCYGARVAGPITSLMMEKYLKGKAYRCDFGQQMLKKSLEHEYLKPYLGQKLYANQ